MAEKNKVQINISGYSYTLVGRESVEYLNELASYIDNKINKIMCGNNNLGIKDAGILTAFNVADELFKLQKECENNQRELILKEDL
jgi:cell division protein ZapA